MMFAICTAVPLARSLRSRVSERISNWLPSKPHTRLQINLGFRLTIFLLDTCDGLFCYLLFQQLSNQIKNYKRITTI